MSTFDPTEIKTRDLAAGVLVNQAVDYFRTPAGIDAMGDRWDEDARDLIRDRVNEQIRLYPHGTFQNVNDWDVEVLVDRVFETLFSQ